MSKLVTLYTKPGSCGQCNNTKRALKTAGIPYQEIVVNESDKQSIDELKLIASKKNVTATMPYVLVMNMETKESHDWFGFQPDEIKKLAKEPEA